MRIFTMQMAKARFLKGYRCVPLDTTVKSGIKAFAPAWDMVMQVKSGIISEAVYTQRYYVLMRNSFKRYPSEWEEVFGMDDVVLICYCKAGCFCHRHLLLDIYTKAGPEYGVTVIYGGELETEADVRRLLQPITS